MSVVFEFDKNGKRRNNANVGLALKQTSCESASSGGKQSRSLDECLQELNNLVGMEKVKETVESLVSLVRVRKARESAGYAPFAMSLHLVFTGNPGTGKTTVARLISEIYQCIGVLSSGHLVEVDRSGLVGGYVGQTAIKTKEVVDRAKGGVLFIDEAYALTVNRGDNDYGYEAVDTLLKAMEDYRQDLIVIVAGYSEPMAEFLGSNPGLRSRFNNFIEFPDYSADELNQIFTRMCTSNGLVLSDAAKSRVKRYFCNLYDNRKKNFANAREVRNYLEKVMMNQANRIASSGEPLEGDLLLRIEEGDIIPYQGI